MSPAHPDSDGLPMPVTRVVGRAQGVQFATFPENVVPCWPSSA